MIDFVYYRARVCYWLHEIIGYRYPYAVNGRMVERFPIVQRWLASFIPYDSW